MRRVDADIIDKYRLQVVNLEFIDGYRIRAHIKLVWTDEPEHKVLFGLLDVLAEGTPPRYPYKVHAALVSPTNEVTALSPTDGLQYVQEPGFKPKPWWRSFRLW